MNRCYVAYCHDRHIKPEIRVFFSHARAVRFARRFVKENFRHPEYWKETESGEYRVDWHNELEYDHCFVDEVALDDTPES